MEHRGLLRIHLLLDQGPHKRRASSGLGAGCACDAVPGRVLCGSRGVGGGSPPLLGRCVRLAVAIALNAVPGLAPAQVDRPDTIAASPDGRTVQGIRLTPYARAFGGSPLTCYWDSAHHAARPHQRISDRLSLLATPGETRLVSATTRQWASRHGRQETMQTATIGPERYP